MVNFNENSTSIFFEKEYFVTKLLFEKKKSAKFLTQHFLLKKDFITFGHHFLKIRAVFHQFGTFYSKTLSVTNKRPCSTVYYYMVCDIRVCE